MFRAVSVWIAMMCAIPAHATSVVALDPIEQAAESTAIVQAVVGEAVQVSDRGEGFTHTQLVVTDVLAGNAPSTVTIRQQKGIRADGAKFYVIGDAELTPGETVVAFVRDVGESWWALTALNQSVWHVAEDGSVARTFDGLEMYVRTPNGVVPSNESPMDFETLNALKAEARELTCGGGR